MWLCYTIVWCCLLALDIGLCNLISGIFVVHCMFDRIHHVLVVIVFEGNHPRFVTGKFDVSEVATHRRAIAHRKSRFASMCILCFSSGGALHPPTPSLNKTIVFHDMFIENIDNTTSGSEKLAKFSQLLFAKSLDIRDNKQI